MNKIIIFSFIFILSCSTNSIYVPNYYEIIEKNGQNLKKLKIGILINPNRNTWESTVDGEIIDKREDENKLFANFLKELDIFGDVVLVNQIGENNVDYTISLSVETIYNIELDGLMYFFNTYLTLGIGYLLGVPYQDSSAMYIANAVFYYKNKNYVVGGSLSENYKVWHFDNMYWRPDFYGTSALEPLFEQILYDFLTRSGCLSE